MKATKKIVGKTYTPGTCTCGMILLRGGYKTHIKSKKHKDNLDKKIIT